VTTPRGTRREAWVVGLEPFDPTEAAFGREVRDILAEGDGG
jgi:hypothetical protein